MTLPARRPFHPLKVVLEWRWFPLKDMLASNRVQQRRWFRRLLARGKR
jgi:hypothetical protein